MLVSTESTASVESILAEWLILILFLLDSCKPPLFGKSRPDFAFYKQIGNELTGGMIIELDSLYGSTLEFKKDSSLLKLAQAFANMVRVANDLLRCS